MTKTMRSAGPTRKPCTVAQAENAALLSQSHVVLKDTQKSVYFRTAGNFRKELSETSRGTRNEQSGFFDHGVSTTERAEGDTPGKIQLQETRGEQEPAGDR